MTGHQRGAITVLAGPREGVITARDWSPQGVITVTIRSTSGVIPANDWSPVGVTTVKLDTKRMLTLLGPVAARRYHGPGWSPNGVISAYLLVTRRVLSQLETGPPGGGYHSPSWSPGGVFTARAMPDPGMALYQ